MQSGQEATLNAREARKQRLLAKAQQRLQRIECGGPPSSPHQSAAAPEPVSKVLPTDSKVASNNLPVIRDPMTPDAKPKLLQPDRSPASSLTGSSSDERVFPPAEQLGTITTGKEARPTLQPAHSAALQPVSSPLPIANSDSDCDSDGSPAAVSISLPMQAADPTQQIDLAQSAPVQLPHAVHSENFELGVSKVNVCEAEYLPAPAAPVSAAVAGKGHGSPNDSRQSKQASRDNDPSQQKSPAEDFRRSPVAAATASVSSISGWTSRIEHAAAATAAIRTVTSAVLAVMTIAASQYDRQAVAARDYDPQTLERSPTWSAVNSELVSLPPLLLLLATNLTLIMASFVFGSGRRAEAAASDSGSLHSETGLIQRVLRAAVPRLYAVVAAVMPLVGALWQDVAVLAFVGALATFVMGPHFEQHRE